MVKQMLNVVVAKNESQSILLIVWNSQGTKLKVPPKLYFVKGVNLYGCQVKYLSTLCLPQSLFHP